jgi:hypothetical protein
LKRGKRGTTEKRLSWTVKGLCVVRTAEAGCGEKPLVDQQLEYFGELVTKQEVIPYGE